MGTQVSFCPADNKVILVTGNNVYRFFRVTENLQLKPVFQSLAKKESYISSNFTAHAWLKEGRFLITTD